VHVWCPLIGSGRVRVLVPSPARQKETFSYIVRPSSDHTGSGTTSNLSASNQIKNISSMCRRTTHNGKHNYRSTQPTLCVDNQNTHWRIIPFRVAGNLFFLCVCVYVSLWRQRGWRLKTSTNRIPPIHRQ
jgi:hypothetical protein